MNKLQLTSTWASPSASVPGNRGGKCPKSPGFQLLFSFFFSIFQTAMTFLLEHVTVLPPKPVHTQCGSTNYDQLVILS